MWDPLRYTTSATLNWYHCKWIWAGGRCTLFGSIPGTVAMDLGKTLISHHSAWMGSYESVSWWAETQQFRGTRLLIVRLKPQMYCNLCEIPCNWFVENKINYASAPPWCFFRFLKVFLSLQAKSFGGLGYIRRSPGRLKVVFAGLVRKNIILFVLPVRILPG